MKPLPDKKQIVDSIAATAKRLGHAPTVLEFVSHTGTSWYFVSRFFPRWNDAVRAAGLEPKRLRVRPEDSELLKDWAQTVRKKQAIPTQYAYRRHGKYDPRTLEERFGNWSSVPHAFGKFAKGKPGWADVVALLPAQPSKKARERLNGNFTSPVLSSQARHSPLTDRTLYGGPIDFRGLRHEPVNEQGVVFLFGMLAKELGYMVEALQKGFPDCEAKRQIVPGRWQRVLIEFEYESKNFRDHGHPANGCDLIVCWRHNWPDCPKHIEVLELSSVIKSLAKSEN